MEDKYFTYGGKDNNENKVYYRDLPKSVSIKLDTFIKERCVHLDSTFGIAALKGGFDPEKVSHDILVSEGLLSNKN